LTFREKLTLKVDFQERRTWVRDSALASRAARRRAKKTSQKRNQKSGSHDKASPLAAENAESTPPADQKESSY